MPYADIEYKREHDRAYQRARYDNLTGVEYNRMRLRKRREKALQRRRQRTNKED